MAKEKVWKMKLYICCNELWPYYDLEEDDWDAMYDVELTDEEHKDYIETMKAFWAWQKKLGDLYDESREKVKND